MFACLLRVQSVPPKLSLSGEGLSAYMASLQEKRRQLEERRKMAESRRQVRAWACVNECALVAAPAVSCSVGEDTDQAVLQLHWAVSSVTCG